MYTPEVIDHFEHPRNVGEIADADASVQVENPACGDILRLELLVDSGSIIEARFKTKGCVAAIAAGSAITEMIHGKRISEAVAIQREQLVAKLGGLSNESMHVSHLALDALSAALKQLQAKAG